VKLSCDEAKRRVTLDERGLDFASATDVFDGVHFSAEDERKDYGERRNVSAGYVSARLCVVVWTPRDGRRHIISMRKANDREQKRFKVAIEQS
jgi:uncharacterized DUF497 family protein